MIPVTTFTPDPQNPQQANLILQSGWVEVINDSNYLLIIQNNNGQCYQVPGVAMLYPAPIGGGSFFISPQPIFTYMFTDLGISNNVVVNQYLEGEIPPSVSYPYVIVRSANVAINSVQQIHANAYASAMSAGLSATLNSLAPPDSLEGSVYLCGIDLTIDQESTAHGYIMQINSIGSEQETFQYVFHSNTTYSTQFLRTYDPPLVANTSGASSTLRVSIAGVAGATARGALNIYGVFQ